MSDSEEYTIPAKERTFAQLFMLKDALFQRLIHDKDAWKALSKGFDLKHRMETWEGAFGPIDQVRRTAKWGVRLNQNAK